MDAIVGKKESMTLWDELKKIDVSDHVEKKGKLSYLSWSWAWSTLMNECPDAEFEFRDWDGSPAFFYPDGTASVECTVSVGKISRTMWLPVMNHSSKVVKNPDALTISNSKMRCLTKAIGLLGIGMYLYAGDDLPPTDKDQKPDPEPEMQGDPEPEMQGDPEPEMESKPNGQDFAVEGVVNTYRVFLRNSNTKKELVAFWRENKEELEKLEKAFPATYKSVLDCFKSRQQEISQGE